MKRREWRSAGRVLLFLSMHTSSSGGSAETLHVMVHVSPLGWPSSSSVETMVTPVGNALISAKNDARSMASADDERSSGELRWGRGEGDSCVWGTPSAAAVVQRVGARAS